MALRWILRLSAAFQGVYWGGTHLFAPDWYLRSIGVVEPATGFVRVALNEIGVLSFAMALGTAFLAQDPAGNRPLLFVLLFAGVASAVTSAVHVASGAMPSGEWVTVVALVLQTVLVAALYPWKEAGARSRAPAKGVA